MGIFSLEAVTVDTDDYSKNIDTLQMYRAKQQSIIFSLCPRIMLVMEWSRIGRQSCCSCSLRRWLNSTSIYKE